MEITIETQQDLDNFLKNPEHKKAVYFVRCKCGKLQKRAYKYIALKNFKLPLLCKSCTAKELASRPEVAEKKRQAMLNMTNEQKQKRAEKSKKSCLKKYGCEYSFQSQNNKEKSKKTKKEKYGNENYNNSDKAFISKYGETREEHSEKRTKEEVLRKEKIIENRNSAEFKAKMSKNGKKAEKALKEKYGKNYRFDFAKKAMETKKAKNNGKGISDESLEKMRKTNIKKYGFEYAAQAGKCLRKLYTEDGFNFDSSWELKFYRYLKLQNKNFICHPNRVFSYTFNGKEHFYLPDFEVDGILYEIKGDHFFEGNKMICPWDRTKDDLYEAKHQCMLKNGVKILKRKELNELGIKVF